jgi:predicted homoserine dehydrogenase-like protein
MVFRVEAESTSVYHGLRRREESQNPIRVAVIGAGSAGRSIALQLATPVPGIRLVGLANRTRAHGERSLREAGITQWSSAESAAAAAALIRNGEIVLTEDHTTLTRCDAVDLIIEVTGSIEFAATVVLDSIDHGKAIVLVNADLDSLLGPILNARASCAGVLFTHTDGDEPGVAMSLLRYLQSLGLRTVAAGNIKGMVDYYRTPDTQAEYAKRHDQDARKVTSFADATKLSMETTVLANATGFRVSQRGMQGPACSNVREIASLLSEESMLNGGIVDYCVGAAPHTGAFVVVHEDDKRKQAQLEYYKLGEGPFYVFYTPFHLPHVQISSTIGRAILHKDPTIAPLGGPSCEVIAIAKRSLKSGERLDGIGGYLTYGLIENSTTARSIDALPTGLSEGCVLKRDVGKDEAICFNDIEMPADRISDRLWREQNLRWPQPQKDV